MVAAQCTLAGCPPVVPAMLTDRHGHGHGHGHRDRDTETETDRRIHILTTHGERP